jgi:alkanesulfonate monooxygenase SsuD/methylene tetrahydromethanopterin reductase-like flavin-dependent oxidoreductase (luciferase family)
MKPRSCSRPSSSGFSACSAASAALPRPIDPALLETLWTPQEKAGVQGMLAAAAVGSRQSVQRQLQAIIAQTAADELIVAGAIHDHAARLRSYQLLAGAHN